MSGADDLEIFLILCLIGWFAVSFEKVRKGRYGASDLIIDIAFIVLTIFLFILGI